MTNQRDLKGGNNARVFYMREPKLWILGSLFIFGKMLLMRIISFLRQYQKRFSPHQPLIKVLIHGDRLLHNLRTFQQKYPDRKIAPVLKSNAYGHGLVPVAKILDRQNIAFMAVDSIFEAAVLYKEGIKSKILVIGYTKPQEICSNRYKNVSFTVTNFTQLRELTKELRTKQSFHLKIDTGMHRQGILASEIEKSIERIEKNKKMVLEGICSHFAHADSTDSEYSKMQIQNWNDAVKKFKDRFPSIKYFHNAATAASHYSQKNTNVIRLGIGLYGLDTSPNRVLDLEPALELRTIISGVKTIQKGEYIGYGLTFKANRKIKVATVPAGYFEGVDRRLSSCGCYKIKDRFCPILGRVSMNISVIDVSEVPGIKVGDPVTLISSSKKDRNSAWRVAKLCNTIPYDILVHIPQHLRREVV